MQIIPLSEGSFTIGHNKQFVPFDTRSDDLQQRTSGSLLVEIQPFCVVTQKDVLLLDTGLGFCNPDGTLQIHQHLLDKGIHPMEVTKVLLTHLHKDHAGGISREDKVLRQQFFSFPSATYYVNRQEMDFALQTGKPSYTPAEFSVLNTDDKVVFTEGNGVLDGYIHYEVTGAHCPFHQVFRIEEEGQTLFFGGDVAPQLTQMKSRFIAKYDDDGRRSMELRKHWWERGHQEHWTFLFYHDIHTPTFRCGTEKAV